MILWPLKTKGGDPKGGFDIMKSDSTIFEIWYSAFSDTYTFTKAGKNQDTLEPDAKVIYKFQYIHEMASEIINLQMAIRRHRDAKGHDRCWENDNELYEALNESIPDSELPENEEEFLDKCKEYYNCHKKKLTIKE